MSRPRTVPLNASRMLRHGSALLVGAFLVLSSPALASGPWDGSWRDKMFRKSWKLTPRKDQILVQFQPDADADLPETVRRAHGLTEIHPYHDGTRTVVYRVSIRDDSRELADLLASEPGIQGAAPTVVDQDGYTKNFIPTEVTVQFRKDLDEESCRLLLSAAGCEIVRDHWTPGYYTVTLPEGKTVFETIRMWQSHPQTLFSEPSYMLYDDFLHVPNDEHYPDQWALNNTGGHGGGTPGADVEAEEAWDIYRGDPGVILCIIDSGMDLDHPDLQANLLDRGGEDWDFSGDGILPLDGQGHGTKVSGVAVAVQDNEIGVSGIAPRCRVMPLKISGIPGENQQRADAINYATSRRPEFKGLVINGSWAMSSGDFTAVEAACQNAWDNDVILCFASGNDNIAQIEFPAAYPTTIAVGASSPCDERKSPTSCDGEDYWGSQYGPELDVVAPGVKIYTTRLGGNYDGWFNGTSAASPLAAGICALIWSANPTLTNDQVRQILRDSAEDMVGPPEEDTPGWDPYMGYGRVNARRALELAVPDAMADSMETEGSWTHEVVFPFLEYKDGWHLSDQRHHTPGGQFSWKCGDSTEVDYDPEISAALVSPPFRVVSGSAVTFWHWMDLYAPDDEIAGDGAVIEATTDGGATWLPRTPLNGYTHEWTGDSVPFSLGQPVWSGSFDWRQETVLLGDLAGTARIRFRMGTRGELPTGEGWYVDDVVVTTDAAGAPVATEVEPAARLLPIWPNPAHGFVNLGFYLAESSPVKLSVHDIRGRLLRRYDLGLRIPGAHAVVFDGRDRTGRPLPAGIYLYKMTAGRTSETGRLVLVE